MSDHRRSRLFVGLVLIAAVAAGLALGFSRLGGGPDLGRVVYATDEALFERDLASGDQRRLADLPSDTIEISPAPDGRWVAYARRRGDLWLLDLDDGSRWQVSEQLSAALGWTRDGRLVAGEFLSDRDVVAVDPADRGSRLLVSGYRGGLLYWTDDDHFLTSVAGDAVLIDVGARPPTSKRLADGASPLAVSPGGKQVLLNEGDENLTIASLDGDELGAKRKVFDGKVARATVSPQGLLAFTGRDASRKPGTWVLESVGKSPRHVLRTEADAIAWSLDGSALITLVKGRLTANELRDDRVVGLARGSTVKSFAVVT